MTSSQLTLFVYFENLIYLFTCLSTSEYSFAYFVLGFRMQQTTFENSCKDSENLRDNNFLKNTSLAAQGALAHRLQCRPRLIQEIIPFPVWIIPFMFVKLDLDSSVKMVNLLLQNFLSRGLEIGEIIPFPV